MKIGMILVHSDKAFPPDIRVEKEIKALEAHGHEVILLNAGPGIKEDSESTWSQSKVVYRKAPYKKRLSTYFTLIFHELKHVIATFIDTERPDLLHVHDFTYLPTTFAAVKGRELPIIADLHENMPAAKKIYRQSFPLFKRILMASILQNIWLWKHLEKKYLLQCAHVIVVVDEAKKRLVARGLNPAKLSVVSNTENKDTFSYSPGDQTKLDVDMSDRWVLSYVGGVGPHRGVDTVIRALPFLIKTVPSAHFVIVGASAAQQKALCQLARQLNVENHLSVYGWQPFDNVSAFLDLSDVCLVPHNKSEHTQTTIPHKLFQYMLTQRVIVVSDVDPLQRVIGERACGYVFEADNPESCAATLVDVYENKTIAQQRANLAQKLANGVFSWSHDAKTLCQLYDAMKAR